MVSIQEYNRVDSFVSTYGRGDIGLNTLQKKARIEKLLGVEKEKVKGFGQNKNEGIEFNSEMPSNLSDYPKDIRSQDNHKIFNIVIEEDGTTTITGINNEDKYSVEYMGDDEAARSELNQFKKGLLKEVSDRTMIIHKNKGDLDTFFESEEIDTNEDKELQY